MGRPWITDDILTLSQSDPYAEFAAWKRWFSNVVEDPMPDDELSILDWLSVTQEAHLYAAMCRLADGEDVN